MSTPPPTTKWPNVCSAAVDDVLRVSACCHDPFPSSAAHTQQIFWTLVEVARRGPEVRLHYPDGREGQEGREGQAGQDGQGGQGGRSSADALGSWYGVPQGLMPSTLTIDAHRGIKAPRWLSQASFDYRMPAVIDRDRPDVVWTRNVAAALWLTRAGLPTVFETYRPDIARSWRFAAWRKAVLGSPALRGVIHHSRLADEAFARAGVPDSRRLVARNGFAPEWMEPRLDRDAARRLLGLDADRALVVYSGDVHPAKGIAALVRLAAAVPDAHLLIVGADDEEGVKRTEAMARHARAANVSVRRRVAIGALAPYLYAADCLVIPPPNEPMERSRTVLPIKVFLYMAAGRAILAPRRPDIEEVLTDGLTAQLTPPNDDVTTARALRELLEHTALRERLGREARHASTQYTWGKRAERVLDWVLTL